jgi:hypothetical protein
MACPGYHYHRKAFLAYKRRTETKKKKREKDRGDEGKTQGERDDHSTNSPLLPESSFFFFSFSFFPSADQRTHQPLYLSISFYPFIFKSKPATSGFPGFFEDFGHRTPKPPTAFPSHQQPTIFPHATTLLPQLIIFLPHAALPLRETVVH